jgi:twitching motility protein PilT
VGEAGFEPAKAEPTGLQPVPFGHSGTPPAGRKSSPRVWVFREREGQPIAEEAMDLNALLSTELDEVARQITEGNLGKREGFYASGDLDTSYTVEGLGRFRVNGFRQRGSVSFAFRHVPREIPSFEQLGLPAGVQRLAEEHRGLVLVTGATGSGKSTTLAAMVDMINRTRRQHIVTIEDPIEIVHADRGCIVNQREVGLDVESYGQALRRVLRQDPDVILIGELRDDDSAKAALQASESGHFVLSTMHTIDAAETVGRLIEFFPSGKQMMVRQILAGVLRGVVSQRLLPAIDGGRVPAVEVMVNTARISDLIRDPEKTDGIHEALEEGSFHHMQSFGQHLVELVLEGRVDFETAAAAATNRHDFEIDVQQALRRQQAAANGTAPEDSVDGEGPAGEPEDGQAVGLRLAP